MVTQLINLKIQRCTVGRRELDVTLERAMGKEKERDTSEIGGGGGGGGK